MSEEAQVGAEEGVQKPPAEGGPAAEPSPNGSAEAANGAGEAANASNGKTLAQGAESPEGEEKPYWPNDWRQRVADHAGAGDPKAVKRELKRLERVTDPNSIYGMYRELEGKFTSGNIIKMPDKDATEEDVSAYHKALGVPESAEDYLKDFAPENGAVLGDADKAMAESFVKALVPAGAPKQVLDTAVNWYFKNEEEQASQLDEMDETFRQTSERELKDEMGPAYKRKVNNIASVFAKAPGGADVKNEESVYARILGGRTSDGKLIGNDPDVTRWLAAMAQEMNPAGSIVEDAEDGGKTLDARIKDIETQMRKDRPAYNKDPQMQAEYRELLDARERIQAKA